MTSEERDIVAPYYTKAMADLEETWGPKLKVEIANAYWHWERDDLSLPESDDQHVARPDDDAIVIAFELNSGPTSGLVRICYPVKTIEPGLPFWNNDK